MEYKIRYILKKQYLRVYTAFVCFQSALFEDSNKPLGFKRTCPLLIAASNYLPKESPPWRYYRSCSYNNVKKKVP
jgi:hypothetical protein